MLTVENGVGIVTIHGALMKRPDFFARLLLDATDMEDVAAALEAARDRADVQAVFLDVDSPGGTVNGTPELAALVADVSKAKYTYAFTDGQMCSAAYWIASQADAIFATPSARVGSIGVLMPMLDETKAFEQAGLKVELFAAGKFKSIGVAGHFAHRRAARVAPGADRRNLCRLQSRGARARAAHHAGRDGRPVLLRAEGVLQLAHLRRRRAAARRR